MRRWIWVLAIGGVAGLWSLEGGAQSIQNEIYRPPKQNKFSTRLADAIQTVQSGRPLKVWVFFTDKGIRSRGELDQALAEPGRLLTARALKRRSKVRPPGRLVDFADLPLYEPYVRAVLSTGVRIRARSRWFNAISVWASPSQALEIAQLPFVAWLKLVAGAKRDEPRRDSAEGPSTLGAEGVPKYRLDYGASLDQLEQIQVPLLHELGYSGRGVLVAMFDVGFFKDHEAFSRLNVVAERDFVMGDDDTQWDPNDSSDYSDSHGTLTWSTLAGFKEGKLVGPAYGADFLLAKTEDTRSETPIEEDYWAAAAEWADSLGADVISSSLGYYDWYSFEDMDGNTAVCTVAADWAAKQGIAVVVAAGNWNNTEWGHISAPADGDSVISVGAVNQNGVIADFSSRGPTYDGRIKPEVCARGVGTRCATRQGPTAYGYASGTSLSTPLIGGVCALLLEVHPEWSGWDVRQALISTASQAHRPDNTYGWGIARAFDASGVHAAVPVVASFQLLEGAATANGVVDPGEEVGFQITLRNAGNEATSGGTLRFRSPQINLVWYDSTATFGRLEPLQEITLATGVLFRAPSDLDGLSAIPIEFEIRTNEGRVFQRRLQLRVAGMFTVKGAVWDLSRGTPARGATVTFRPLLAPADSVFVTFTNSSGEFETALPAGDYVAQARGEGYFPSLTAKFSLPAWESGEIQLALTRPALRWEVGSLDTVGVDPGWASGVVRLSNAGHGPLFVTAIPLASPFGGARWSTTHHRLVLWQDPLEHSVVDVLGFSEEAVGDSLFLTVSHYARWPDSLDVRWVLWLDCDDDPATGESVGGLGADFRIVAGSLEGWGERWDGAAWVRVSGKLPTIVEGRELRVAVPETLLSSFVQFVAVPAYLAAQVRRGDEFRTYDHVPDRGPWRLYLQALPLLDFRFSQSSYVLAAGQTSSVTFSFKRTTWSERSLHFLLISWDPAGPVVSAPVHFVTSVASGRQVPQQWFLAEPYPNPFNGRAQIEVTTPGRGKFVLQVFDSVGRVVRQLHVGRANRRRYSFQWDATDESGRPLSSGLYLLQLRSADGFRQVRKLLLLR